MRKSSLPLEGNAGGGAAGVGTGTSNVNSGSQPNGLTSSLGLCRAESFPVLLDCSQGAGIILGSASSCGRAVSIAQIQPDSVADRSGCIQPGDRIVAINKMYSLDAASMRQLLEGRTAHAVAPAAANWLELEVEFDMPDAVVPSSGVFNVKLLRTGKCGGLGLSVSGSSHAGLVISDVKMGSPAHRCGSLRPGDILLAVDQHPVQHFNVDALLKELPSPTATTTTAGTAGDFTTLTIKRIVLPDFLPSPIYSNCSPAVINAGGDNELYSSAAYVAAKYGEVKYNDCISLKSSTPQPDYFRAASLDDTGSLQSVQLRHAGNAGAGASASNTSNPSAAWTTACASGRSYVTAPNTQSLTTELPEEEDCEEEDDEQEDLDSHHYGGYELNRYAR